MLKKILAHLITCRRATHLVSNMQERRLGVASRTLLKLHLAWCVACLRFERQMRFLREAMARYRA
jgi:hypothetical protein